MADDSKPPGGRWLSWPLGRRAAVPLMVGLALLLLAAALVPQERSFEQEELAAARERHPVVMGVLDELGATRVAGSPALYLGSILLVLSLALDTARRARALPKRLSRQGGLLSAAAVARSAGAVRLAGPPAGSLDTIERALRRRGFSVRREGDRLQAERGRSGAVGSVVFHGGLVLLAAGALWSTATRFHGVLALGVGQAVDTTQPLDWAMILPEGTPAEDLPALRFTVGPLDLRFAEDGTLTYSRVTLITPDGVAHPIAVNEPYRQDGVAVRLADYGLAPVFVVRDPRTRTERGAAMKLQVLPPGMVDAFQFPDLDQRFEVEIYPDAERVDGQLRSRSAQVLDPVAVIRTDGQSLTLPLGRVGALAGYEVALRDIVYWVRLEVDRDPARQLIFGALLAGMIGLIWRLLLPWIRVDAAATEDGVVLAFRGERGAGQAPERYAGLADALRATLASPEEPR